MIFQYQINNDNQNITFYLLIMSTEKDVENRIALAWVVFSKLKSILRSPEATVKFKMRLFKASCISVLRYTAARHGFSLKH